MATLRVFYGLSKTEITGIKGISPITHILNAPSNCTIILADFEGSLYSTWKDKQFETIYITNSDASKYYFVGYVSKLYFRKDDVEIQCTGWSGKLDHINFERNYQYVVGLVKSDPPYSGSNYKLEVKDESTLADFAWTDDQWISPAARDKGICVSDNTGDTTSNWTTASYSNNGFSSVILSGGDWHLGVDNNDGYWHEFRKTEETWNNIYVTIDITGSIPTTSLIKQIDLEYNFGIKDTNGNGSGCVWIEIYNFTTATWIQYEKNHVRFCNGQNYNWTGLQKFSFTGTDAQLKQYLQTSGGNYVTLRVRLFTQYGSITAGYKSVYLNYLKGSIKYRPKDYTPVQGKITDNGASWIEATSIDFVAKGVRAGDRVMIGENTLDIATAVIGSVGCNADIDSNFNKFIARYLRGNSCNSVINSICALESAYWAEQYSSDLPLIVMKKPANFVDSGVTLTSTEYGNDFEIERPSNNYRYVEVFGNQYWNVYAIADSCITTSSMTYTITDETISTDADAQSIADGQLALLQNVRESIKISVRGNVADNIQVGTLVTLVMERPTISSAQYPVRRITRSLQNYPNGEIITTLWLGLGETPDEESIGKSIRKALTTARKAITDKLIPQSAGGLPVISYTSLTNKPTIPTLATSITDGDTTHAPDCNAVYDALAGKSNTSHDHDATYEAKNSNIQSHISNTSNPHSVTKTQLSLGNVTNDAQLKRSANDYSSITEKTTPANDDLVLIEDSADSYNKKKVKRSNLAPASSVYDGIRDGQTTSSPSENAVYDALAGKVSTSGNETIAGIKTFSNPIWTAYTGQAMIIGSAASGKHAYGAFYPDGLAGNRAGWFGFGADADTEIYFTNERTNGSVRLVPNGTGTVHCASKRVSNVANPTSAQDAATKDYVDNKLVIIDADTNAVDITLIGTGNGDNAVIDIRNGTIDSYTMSGGAGSTATENLSGIANATAVFIRLMTMTYAPGGNSWYVKDNGNSNDYRVVHCRNYASSQYYEVYGWVKLDSTGHMKVISANTTAYWNHCYIMILAYQK